MEQIDNTKSVPRDTFNSRLAGRYWDIPTDIPQATPYNTPIGTYPCDTLGFLCHPQKYETFHHGRLFDGFYPETDIESSLYNLDQYNLYDLPCHLKSPQQLRPELVSQQYSGIQRKCQLTPRLWNNTTKLYKYNQY
jgi:hypothetical protein